MTPQSPAPQSLTATEALYRRLIAAEWAKSPADAAHDLGHLARVWANARKIALTEVGDLPTLLAAAYFHDLVNLPKSAPNRDQASRLSATAARTLLLASGLPAAQVENASHEIANVGADRVAV